MNSASPEKSEDNDIAAVFFDQGSHNVDEPERGGADEWTASLITGRVFSPEGLSNLGGTPERVTAAMSARTITVKRRDPATMLPDEPQFPRSPSEMERARTSRKSTESRDERVSKWQVLGLAAVVMLLIVILLMLASGR
jgi:hypothetical protein